MNGIQIIQNAQFGALRTLVLDDQVWFVGKDVATILGYTDTAKAVKMHVDEDDKLTRQIVVSGQRREMTIINESGLYSLILSSKQPQARQFKHWVTNEVLPQIRQTGGYIPLTGSSNGSNGLSDAEVMARALLIAQKTIEMKDKLLEAQQKKVEFADAVVSCKDSILIRDLAKLITQNGVNIGQGRLFYWLRLHGYLFQNETRPIQKWVERGLFDTTVSIIHTNHGTIEKITTKVTGKGQEYFVSGFKSGKFAPHP